MPGSVHVRGLRELNRAFKNVEDDLRRDLRGLLKEAAEPVRQRAEQLAVSEISHIGDQWSRMRIGVTTKVVYVAPKRRGSRGGPMKRPNLGPLLMDRAMEPALEENTEETLRLLETALDRIGRKEGF